MGKSVKRKGTLFVGEEYVVRTARAPGMEAAEASFIVDERPKEVVVSVSREHRSLTFELLSSLAETTHWSRDLPLPESIGYEIIHCESGVMIHEGRASAQSETVVPGDVVGLYVGERYRLRVRRASAWTRRPRSLRRSQADRASCSCACSAPLRAWA